MLTILSYSSSSRVGQLGDTSITSMEIRAAGSRMSVGRTYIVGWMSCLCLDEETDGSKELCAFGKSKYDGGGEDVCAREPGDAGDAGSNPLHDPDTLSTPTCL